jgi:hypothetical protein
VFIVRISLKRKLKLSDSARLFLKSDNLDFGFSTKSEKSKQKLIRHLELDFSESASTSARHFYTSASTSTLTSAFESVSTSASASFIYTSTFQQEFFWISFDFCFGIELVEFQLFRAVRNFSFWFRVLIGFHTYPWTSLFVFTFLPSSSYFVRTSSNFSFVIWII